MLKSWYCTHYTAGEVPSLTGLTDVIKYNDEVFAGDLLFTFTATDSDLEDANSLVITINSSTIYFGLQNTSKTCLIYLSIHRDVLFLPTWNEYLEKISLKEEMNHIHLRKDHFKVKNRKN